MKRMIVLIACILLQSILINCYSQSSKQTTYCNPVNIDYGYTPIPSFATCGKHRATADPVIVNYK